MRMTVILSLCLVVVATAYWLVAARMIAAQSSAFLAQSAQITAELGPVRGFPTGLALRLARPMARDASGAPLWQAEALDLSARSWQPQHVALTFPEAQTLHYAGRTHALETRAMRGALTLGLGGRVHEASLALEAATLPPALVFTEIGETTLSLAQIDGPRYALGANIDAPALAPIMRPLIDPQDRKPDALERLQLRAEVEFTQALRIDTPTPALTGLDLTEASLTWGALQIAAQGQITRSEDGLLDGTLELSLQDWRPFHQILIDTGLLAPDVAMMAGMFLSNMTGSEGRAITLPLSLRRSVLSLGPFELARIPPL